MTFSANQSGKTGVGTSTTEPGRATPFDQISALEQSESARVEREMHSFEEERKQAAKALQDKQEREEQELRAKAQEELRVFREKELSGILEEAQGRAAEERKELETSCKKQEKEVVSHLVTTMTDGSFLSTAA